MIDDSWYREAAVPGAITWHGYVIPCDRCGAEGPWTLRVEKRAYVYGTDAWLTCPNGHLVHHPLIHPTVGLRLIAAPDIMTALGELGRAPGTDWVPLIRHDIDVNPLDYPSSYEPESARITYNEGASFYWADHWPDMWAASLSSASAGTDLACPTTSR